MLSILADVLALASRLPDMDSRLRAERAARRADEDWLAERRAGRFDATKH